MLRATICIIGVATALKVHEQTIAELINENIIMHAQVEAEDCGTPDVGDEAITGVDGEGVTMSPEVSPGIARAAEYLESTGVLEKALRVGASDLSDEAKALITEAEVGPAILEAIKETEKAGGIKESIN